MSAQLPLQAGTLANWTLTPFERTLETSLQQMGEVPASEYLARYVTARDILLGDILNEIRGVEPNLTDHGPDHVRNVLTNVDQLLTPVRDHFQPIELYVLGLGVLFHDVGNLQGRHEHNRRIAEFYDHVRSDPRFAQEKALVVRICKAHTGTTASGSWNTLLEVPQSDHLDGERIRARELAAIIRFADELAEGPQRTSQYLLNSHAYSADSVLHHAYSAATNLCIDPENNRIAVTYQVQVNSTPDLNHELAELGSLLQVIHQRLAKMDLERRYARYHCPGPLATYRRISVSLDVQLDGEFLDLGLETSLSDDVYLNEPPILLSDRKPEWAIDHVLERIRKVSTQNGPGGVGSPAL